VGAARRTLAEMRSSAEDPAQTAEAKAKRTLSLAKRARLAKEWGRAHPGPYDRQEFVREIVPRLANVTLPVMMKATGLTSGYCLQIKKGRGPRTRCIGERWRRSTNDVPRSSRPTDRPDQLSRSGPWFDSSHITVRTALRTVSPGRLLGAVAAGAGPVSGSSRAGHVRRRRSGMPRGVSEYAGRSLNRGIWMRQRASALTSSYELGQVGSSIVLADDEVRASRSGEGIDLTPARVALSPNASFDLTFEGTAQTSDHRWIERALNGWKPTRISVPGLGLEGTVFEETTRVGGTFHRSPYTVHIAGKLRHIQGGSAHRLRDVLFHVVNFPDFIGDWIEDESGKAWRGRLELVGSGWTITLDERRNHRDLMADFRKKGGYAITHIGTLRRGDGRRFSREDAMDVLAGLHWFLSFVRGAWTSPVLFEGHGVRSSRWHYCDSPRTDSHHGAFSWADPTSWAAVREAYASYSRLWNNPVWQQALRVAIGQYTSANDPNPLETAIIAAQSGLELLGWLQFVESGSVLAAHWRDPSRFPARKKISDLLALASVDTSLPAGLPSLVRLHRDWRSGPEVVAGVRNKLVHPRRTSTGVGWSSQILVDTWLLASSYLELALLFALDVQSQVRNRILSPSPWVGSTMTPPWATARD